VRYVASRLHQQAAAAARVCNRHVCALRQHAPVTTSRNNASSLGVTDLARARARQQRHQSYQPRDALTVLITHG